MHLNHPSASHTESLVVPDLTHSHLSLWSRTLGLEASLSGHVVVRGPPAPLPDKPLSSWWTLMLTLINTSWAQSGLIPAGLTHCKAPSALRPSFLRCEKTPRLAAMNNGAGWSWSLTAFKWDWSVFKGKFSCSEQREQFFPGFLCHFGGFFTFACWSW